MYSNVYGVKHVNSIITSQWFMVWKSFRPGAWLQCPGACLKLYAIQCFSRPSILSIIWRRSPYPCVFPVLVFCLSYGVALRILRILRILSVSPYVLEMGKIYKRVRLNIFSNDQGTYRKKQLSRI